MTTPLAPLAGLYLTGKAAWSLANDAIKATAPRAALPSFTTPAAAWNYLEAKGRPYTGDPLGGLGDFYLHPERLQAAFNAGQRIVDQLSIDCDDIAGWAHLATRGIPGVTSRVVTVVDAGLQGSHVICVGIDGAGPWAIDTNGFRRLESLEGEYLCRVWTDIYASLGYRYVAAVETPYPW